MKKRILAYLTIFNIGGGNNIQLNIVYLQSLTNSFKKLDVERKKMAYCGRCGRQVPNRVLKCPYCGGFSRRRGAKIKVVAKQLGCFFFLIGLVAVVSLLIASGS